MVFAGVFLTSVLIGQLWNHGRTDLYRSSLRLQFNVQDPGGTALPATAPTALANELQALTSRDLLGKLGRELARKGMPVSTANGGADDAVSQLQAMLQVQPVAGTDVVTVVATGAVPALLAEVLNTLPPLIRAELAATQSQAADARLAAARQELDRLDKTAASRRTQLEQFRSRSDLQSEREDNEAVARSRGLSVALNNAVEKEAMQAARVRALEDAVAGGRSVVTAKDDPTLASLETRASVLREGLRDMERTYTPEFMAMDPQARAQRARLSELERQIALQRTAGQQTVLQAARDDLSTARGNVERLREQLAAARPTLRKEFTSFAQAKTLEDDLAQVEKARRELLERVARLDADERRREATLTVLEPAVVADAPFSPDHGRDTIWVLGGSLLLGALAMALVESFNRAPRAVASVPPTTVVVPMPWLENGSARPLGLHGPAEQAGLPSASAKAVAFDGPAPAVLTQAEAASLLAAARGQALWVCALALMGLTVEELGAIRGNDLDRRTHRMQVRGAWARSLELPDWLVDRWPAPADVDQPLIHDANGDALREPDLQTHLTCAALDAGLPCASSLSLQMLRDTAIDWLLMQGLRFSELSERIGRIDAARLASQAGQADTVPRRSLDSIDALMPALHQPPVMT